MIVHKLLQTVLGIKNNWYERHSYNKATIHLLKAEYHPKSVLDDLIHLFFRIPYIIYKMVIKTSTIPVYHYVCHIIIHIQFLIMFHNSLKNCLPNKMTSITTLFCTKSAIEFGKLLKRPLHSYIKHFFDKVASLNVRHVDTSYFL